MRKLQFNVEYEYGDIVYLRTDPDQDQFIVTGHLINNGMVNYELSQGANNPVYCAEIEISREKNILL